MKKLIVNADDFGYRENINKGIIYAHKNGLVTSASLFVEKEGTGEAVRLAKEMPGLGLGIHVDLDRFFEIDHHKGEIKDLLNPGINLGEIESEVRKQMEKFYYFGLKADHLNSHHHAHLHPKVFPIVCRLTKEFGIPVIRLFSKFYSDNRIFSEMKNIVSSENLKVTDCFIEGWYWGNVDEDYQIAELMTHPGYGEIWRESELAHCCQPKLKEYLAKQQIELLKFSDIA